jgi:hypothetical protein
MAENDLKKKLAALKRSYQDLQETGIEEVVLNNILSQIEGIEGALEDVGGVDIAGDLRAEGGDMISRARSSRREKREQLSGAI